MRSRFFLSGVMATIVALSGCSSRTESGPSLMPSQVAQARQGQVRTPSSLGAYPISLDAFPSSVGAFPISLDAIPICSSLPLPRTASGSIVGAVVGVVGGLVGGLAGGLLGLGGSDQSNAPSGPSGLGQVTAPVGGLLSTVTKKATCGGSVRTGYGIPAGTPASKLPGYQPLHLQGAYGLRNAAKTLGAGQTVAIVTAYADGTVDSDLAVYRSTFGLPACTVANGCLTIMAPNGAPPANTAWAAETAIDTEMVSAICPLCKIVVVEAKSGNIPDLGNAVDAAAALNPAAISNSYAVPEFSDNVAYAQHWRHANTIVLAGAGDTGYGSNFPATVDTVVSVERRCRRTPTEPSGAKRFGRGVAAAAARTSPSLRGKPTKVAHSARPTTSPSSPTPRRESPATRAIRTDGPSMAARASPRRWSPRCSPSPERRRRCKMHRDSTILASGMHGYSDRTARARQPICARPPDAPTTVLRGTASPSVSRTSG